MIELARAIKENTSLVELDIHDNQISGPVLAKLMQAFAENYVLSTIKIEIQTKKVPDAFSCYPLQSMYSFDF